mmetsp:Transcript_10207/g.30736  ORF Transcript_10207/g.30736 Transcript_10207/m.30736 type:complete len:119 (-) Transcript_10207:549-905(-)
MDPRVIASMCTALEAATSASDQGIELFLTAGGLEGVLDCLSQASDRTALLELLRVLGTVATMTGSLSSLAADAHFDVEGLLRHTALSAPPRSLVRIEAEKVLGQLVPDPAKSPLPPIS